MPQTATPECLDSGLQCLVFRRVGRHTLKQFIELGQSGRRELLLFVRRQAAQAFRQVLPQTATPKFLDSGLQCLVFRRVGRHALNQFIEFGQSGRREVSLVVGRQATQAFRQVLPQTASLECPDSGFQCLVLRRVGRLLPAKVIQLGFLVGSLFFKFRGARQRRSGINRNGVAKQRQLFLALVDLRVKQQMADEEGDDGKHWNDEAKDGQVNENPKKEST